MPSTTLINPATELALREVEQTSVEGVDDAVARAVSAQKSWAALAPAARASALRDFATVVGGAIEELASLEVANSGHPISQARWEAGHVRDVLTYYSAAPERMIGPPLPTAPAVVAGRCQIRSGGGAEAPRAPRAGPPA